MQSNATETLSNLITPSFETLKLYGIGFDDLNKSCWNKHLLEKIKERFPSMEITNEIPDQADVIILNANRHLTFPILEKRIPKEDTYVILIVHDVIHLTSAYTKFADHIIYINDLQQYVFEDFLQLESTSTIIPYPFGDKQESAEENANCLIYFEDDKFEKDFAYYENQLKLGLQWHPYDLIKKYYVVFEVPPSKASNFKKIESELAKLDNRIHILNAFELHSEQIYDIASQCFCGQVFRAESTITEYLDLLEQRSSQVMHDSLSESCMLSVFQQLNLSMAVTTEKSSYNFNTGNKATWAEWQDAIDRILRNNLPTFINTKRQIRDNIEIDSVKDLNIIWGSPLKNDFVFSVCFRNQEEKIIRCLKSIVSQTGGFDLGIAIISDCSSDNSLTLILDYIKDIKINICLVDNKERKLIARNLYNVAHSLVTNDESIIIDIDGDDFLATDNVLTTLRSYYDKGCIKTNGSYKIYPENYSFSDTEKIHSLFDTSKPWSITLCQSWLHLRSVKRHLLCQVELDYFLEKKSKKWLSQGHDSATQPRMIELAKDKVAFVKEVLYCYDRSGDFHEIAGDSYDEDTIKSYAKIDKYYHLLDLR